MNFFYYFSLLFLLQFSALSEGRPNLSDIDIETCKCQSYQSCKWSIDSSNRINSQTQFIGEKKIFKDNICNFTTQFVWCCTNSKGQEVLPTAEQLNILKCRGKVSATNFRSTGKSMSEALVLYQLTHNMTKDCSLNYKNST